MRISQQNENCKRQTNHQPPAKTRPQEADNRIAFPFPKTARLLTKRHYQRVLKSGNKFVGGLVIVDYRTGKNNRPKLGITVSRRYGKAHLRNRFKRVVREAFRHYCPNLPQNIEMNVVPRLPFQKINRTAVLDDLINLMSHYGKTFPIKS